MNTGQTLLSALAIVLLGVTVLTVNSNNLNQGTILRQTEIGMYAIGLATSYFEKASNLNFDQYTAVTGPAFATTDLSTTLGPDAGETANLDTTFNDFDDYNGYVAKIGAPVDTFTVKAFVSYLDQNAYTKIATPSWLKQMDVWVIPDIGRQGIMGGTNTAGVDTIKMSYIYSYYQ